MITSEASVLAVVNDGKLYCIVNVNMTDIFNKILELDDIKEQERNIKTLDIQIVTDDVFSDMVDKHTVEDDSEISETKLLPCSCSIATRLNNQDLQSLILDLKEKKEKEKKKYQETKTEKTQKVPMVKMAINPKSTVITDETFQLSKAAQTAIDKMKSRYKENITLDKWTAKQFHQYMHEKYKAEYGYTNLEFGTMLGKRYEKSATGVLWTQIKHKLIDVFQINKLGNSGLKEYIDWCYDKKAPSIPFPITLNMLCSRSLITEWLHYLKTGKI